MVNRKNIEDYPLGLLPQHGCLETAAIKETVKTLCEIADNTARIAAALEKEPPVEYKIADAGNAYNQLWKLMQKFGSTRESFERWCRDHSIPFVPDPAMGKGLHSSPVRDAAPGLTESSGDAIDYQKKYEAMKEDNESLRGYCGRVRKALKPLSDAYAEMIKMMEQDDLTSEEWLACQPGAAGITVQNIIDAHHAYEEDSP